MDEAGVDNSEDYAYGWCAQSERFYALKLGHRTERVNMIAGWCHHLLMAPMTFKGSCNTDLVEAWVEQCLVPQLRLVHGGVNNPPFSVKPKLLVGVERSA